MLLTVGGVCARNLAGTQSFHSQSATRPSQSATLPLSGDNPVACAFAEVLSLNMRII